MSKRRATSRSGFSIIEATLATLLIGTTLVAAMNVSAAAHRASADANHRRDALRLAHVLMAEIMAQPASGTDATNAGAGPRLANFDHVLDYVGLRQSPPLDMQDNPLASNRWAWGVDITTRGNETVDTLTLDLRMYQIVVFVELPDGSRVQLTGLRSSSDALQRPPLVNQERTVQVPISITLPDGTTLTSSPMVWSERAPAGSKPTLGVR